jgi:kumamolisin
MRRFAFSLAVLTAIVFAAVSIGHADPSSRIPGNHPLDAEHRFAIGNTDATQSLAMELHLKLRNEAELDRFLADVQNPQSPQYRKFLKPGEFDQKYGPLQSDLDAIAGWLRAEGFNVTPTSGSVEFSGTVVQAEHTFAVHILKLSATEFSNVEDPMVPARFASLIGNIQGMDNLTASQPLVRISRDAKKYHRVPPSPHKITRAEALAKVTGGAFALSSSPDTSISPYGVAYGDVDMRNTYDVPSTTTIGGGDCIGIIGTSDFLDAALTAFTNQFSDLPAINVTRVLAPSHPGKNGAEEEAELDIEWSHVMAPGAPINFYLGSSSDTGLQDAITKGIDDDKCKVISISFGYCGVTSSFYTSTLDGLFKKAAGQGQSVFIATGDTGAAGYVVSDKQCVAGSSPNVSEMAADPNVTAVGGTQILNPDYNQNDVAQGYATETVWNNPELIFGGSGASGGGDRTLFAIPVGASGGEPVHCFPNRPIKPARACRATVSAMFPMSRYSPAILAYSSAATITAKASSFVACSGPASRRRCGRE